MDAEQERRASELREILAVDPGSSEFVELAKLLIESSETRAECREVCFKGLNRDPKQSLGRVVLARSFYMDGLIEFAVRELVELGKHVSVPSLDRLLDAFGSHAEAYRQTASSSPATSEDENSEGTPVEEDEEEEILAEIDLDDDFVEGALDELEEEIDS